MEMMNQPGQPSVGIMRAEEVREMSEVTVKIRLAKEFRRDPNLALSYTLMECENKDMAASAQFEFPRGGETVKGPSIRLIEIIARNWGNLACGVKELSRVKRPDGVEVATVKAFAWDMETNFQDERVFDVPLIRATKKGSYPLTDPRDQYEMIANQGARRKRACIQAVIPRWVVDKAVERCEEVMADDRNGGTVADRKADMLKAFHKFADWITMEHLADYVNKEPDFITAQDLVRLRRVYTAIEDGFTKPETAFGVAGQDEQRAEEQGAAKDLLGKIMGDGK